MNQEEKLGLAVEPTLFLEFHGASTSQLAEVLDSAKEICAAEGCRDFRPGLGRAERDRIFKARHALGEMIQHNHPEHHILIMDVAVPITRYIELLASMQAEVNAHGLIAYTLSHAGNGNVHLNIAGRKDDPADVTGAKGFRAAGAEDHRSRRHRHRRARGGSGQTQEVTCRPSTGQVWPGCGA